MKCKFYQYDVVNNTFKKWSLYVFVLPILGRLFAPIWEGANDRLIFSLLSIRTTPRVMLH